MSLAANNMRQSTVLQASIILLCGLPGSGKSWLASAIARFYDSRSTLQAQPEANKTETDPPRDTGFKHHSRTVDEVATDTTATGATSSNSTGITNTFHKVVHIEYDTITSSIACKLLAEKNGCQLNNDDSTTRSQRQGVKPLNGIDSANSGVDNDDAAVSDLVCDDHPSGGISFTDHDLEAWRTTRGIALRSLREELSFALRRKTDQNGGEIDDDEKNKRTDGSASALPYGDDNDSYTILILMDDNFHLRSMRRDVYKICQEFLLSETSSVGSQSCPSLVSSPLSPPSVTIGLTIVHVDTPLSTCLARNRTRLRTKQYVPEQTILKMDRTLEVPDPQKVIFESCTISTKATIESTSKFTPVRDTKGNAKVTLSPATITTETINQSAIDARETTSDFFSRLDQTLYRALRDHPVTTPIPNKTPLILEKERRATLQSRLHRQDLLLRTLVGATCRTDSSLARLANGARKIILEEDCDDAGCIESRDDKKCEYSHSNVGDDTWVLKRFEELVVGEGKTDPKYVVGKNISVQDKIREAHANFIGLV